MEYDNEFFEEFGKLSTKRKIIALFIILCIIGIIISISYFCFYKNYYIRSYSTLLGLPIFIAIILSILTAKKIKKAEDRWTLFICTTLFMEVFIHTLSSISLMYSNTPYQTTQAFVHEHLSVQRRYTSQRYKRFYYISHTLYFSDRDKRIIGKSRIDDYIPEKSFVGIFKPEKIPDNYSCYLVAYSHNMLVLNIREVENLGTMSKQECLSQ
ncbi:MAG: hypothetical protein J5680_03740 [Neisseriaceae bacterium]|nr:hypothetical protein [Neisseriaceae bacterium]